MEYYLSKILKKARFKCVRASNIHSTAKVESGSLVYSSSLGKHSFCGYDCNIINASIGGFCSIASRVSIGGASHPVHFVSTSPVFLSHKDSVKAKFSEHNYNPQLETVVGHDVWIGEGAFIKAGVKIGHGAVIGMGSIVTKDVPPYSIVGGNPAKLIRFRFEDELIDDLLAIQWWDWSDEKLSKYAEFFDDPEILVKKVKSRGVI
ncbi:CatB-related O-acetyltransferase [Shewanella colwelliana]|uniref:CatB-related O-acetyltransferase n=1 Tax=Shewanella colwelliana TaxID=23 RepID=UPI0009F4F466|nr:CatB-related O-acetyltransferase [Shewanella colwelliana]